MTNPKEVKSLINNGISYFKKIDILIANAGLYEPAKIISGDPERFDKVINLNVSSVFRIVNLLLPHMKKNNFGDIAITSSISGHQAIYWEPVYSATKHAIQSFAHGLRTQVAKYNIRVISVAPGVVLTELWGINPKVDKQKIKHITNKGNALKGLKRYDEALASYDKAIKINPYYEFDLTYNDIYNEPLFDSTPNIDGFLDFLNGVIKN